MENPMTNENETIWKIKILWYFPQSNFMEEELLIETTEENRNL
jgi:hypothetical protein